MKLRETSWSLLIAKIANAAAKDGFNQRQIETTFKIGDGSGRTWRAWRDGNRIAKPETASRILAEAKTRGWLEDEKAFPLPPLDFVPPHPPGGLSRDAHAAARALLRASEREEIVDATDAVQSIQPIRRRAAKKAKQLDVVKRLAILSAVDHGLPDPMKFARDTEARFRQEDRDARRQQDEWEKGVNKVRLLAAIEDRSHILYERLVRAYREIGYK